MFTGIIEEVGKILNITEDKIVVESKIVLDGTKNGDSIAVNGVCLTVTESGVNQFTADVSSETFRVTGLKRLKSGSFVNLERAMPANGRFGGHIVTGHVDSTAKLERITQNGEFYDVVVKLDSSVSRYVVKKGSISIDGISLTIAEVDRDTIKLAIIPHTFENTNLKTLRQGDFVNIEADIMAKYVEKFLSTSDNRSSIDLDFLQRNGFC